MASLQHEWRNYMIRKGPALLASCQDQRTFVSLSLAMATVCAFCASAQGQGWIEEPVGTNRAVPVVEPYGILAPDENSTCVAVAPDSKTVALSFHKNPLGLYDPTNGKELFRLKKPYESVNGMAFAPDGRTLATTGHCTVKTPVRIWDVASCAALHEICQDVGGCTRLAYSPDSKLLATIEGYSDLGLWNVNTGQRVAKFRQKKGNQVCRLAFSPDGKTLVTGTSFDGIVELWDLSGPAPLADLGKAKPRLTIETGGVSLVHVGYTPKGESLVTACEKNLVQFWDPKTGTLQKTLSVPPVFEKRLGYSDQGRNRQGPRAADPVHDSIAGNLSGWQDLGARQHQCACY
jgi:WD40 repeat protein